MLAASERSSAGLYVHHPASHMLLRIPSKEICESVEYTFLLPELKTLEYRSQIRIFGEAWPTKPQVPSLLV